MVNLLGVELSELKIMVRAVVAIILSGLSLTVLYYAPLMAQNYMKQIQSATLQNLPSQLVDPAVLSIGVLISILVLTTLLLRETKLEGPLLICLGISLLSYWYLLFHGGIINIVVPQMEIQNAFGYRMPITIELNFTTSITNLMLASIIPSILITVKGIILALARLR